MIRPMIVENIAAPTLIRVERHGLRVERHGLRVERHGLLVGQLGGRQQPRRLDVLRVELAALGVSVHVQELASRVLALGVHDLDRPAGASVLVAHVVGPHVARDDGQSWLRRRLGRRVVGGGLGRLLGPRRFGRRRLVGHALGPSEPLVVEVADVVGAGFAVEIDDARLRVLVLRRGR